MQQMTSDPTQQGKTPKTQKGKKPKRFLDKNDAISLAASIGGAQEELAITKAEKHQKPEPEQTAKTDRKPSTNTKAKLKATKAALSAERVKAKKERSKLRKERFKNAKKGAQDSNPLSTSEDKTDKPLKPARKTVSFA